MSIYLPGKERPQRSDFVYLKHIGFEAILNLTKNTYFAGHNYTMEL